MFNKLIKYKKLENEVVDKFIGHISEDHNDYDDVVFFIANIHQWQQTKFEYWSEENINNLLSKHNLDVSVFEVEETNDEEPTINIFDTIVEFVSKNSREYKSEVISYVKSKDQMVKTSSISNQIKRMIANGILESITQSNQTVLSKGRYWDVHTKERA